VFPKIFLLHKVVRDAKKVEKHCTKQSTLPRRFFPHFVLADLEHHFMQFETLIQSGLRKLPSTSGVGSFAAGDVLIINGQQPLFVILVADLKEHADRS